MGYRTFGSVEQEQVTPDFVSTIKLRRLIPVPLDSASAISASKRSKHPPSSPMSSCLMHLPWVLFVRQAALLLSAALIGLTASRLTRNADVLEQNPATITAAASTVCCEQL